MKRFLHFFAFILVSLVVFGNDQFDVTKWYQGKNVMSYLGEKLLVMPIEDITGMDSYDFAKHIYGYKNFKMWYYDSSMSPTTTKPYGYEWYMDHNYTINGVSVNYMEITPGECLEYKTFIVTDIEQYDPKNYWCIYLLKLTNVEDPKDKCVYIYRTDYKKIDSYWKYPFMPVKHLNYLYEKYVGKVVSVDTKNHVEDYSQFKHNIVDENLNVCSFPNAYESFKVEDFYISGKTGLLYFLLKKDGKTYYCPAYSEKYITIK